jgi:hypothetical protein
MRLKGFFCDDANNMHRLSAAVPLGPRATKIKKRKSQKLKIAKTQKCKNRKSRSQGACQSAPADDHLPVDRAGALCRRTGAPA